MPISRTGHQTLRQHVLHPQQQNLLKRHYTSQAAFLHFSLKPALIASQNVK